MAYWGICPGETHRGLPLVYLALLTFAMVTAAMAQHRPHQSREISKTWDEDALRDWATPLAI